MSSEWICGCGWINGCDLSICARCSRNPQEGYATLRGDIVAEKDARIAFLEKALEQAVNITGMRLVAITQDGPNFIYCHKVSARHKDDVPELAGVLLNILMGALPPKITWREHERLLGTREGDSILLVASSPQ